MSPDQPASPPHRRGVCLILAAPSGAGKSTIARALLARHADLTLSVSVTTRAPRTGERDGEAYHFRDAATFQSMVARGELLEWAEVFGRAYGTPRGPVEEALAAGHDVLFDIDWQGHRLVRAALPADTVGVFLLPPSLTALRARLQARGDRPDSIDARMAKARDEMAHWREFDHVVVNRDLDAAVAAVDAVLRAARSATGRQTWLDQDGLPLPA